MHRYLKWYQLFFHRPDLCLEVRLYFVYFRPEIRQHMALIEKTGTDPERGLRTFRKKPGLLKSILREMNRRFGIFVQGSSCRGELYPVIALKKSLKPQRFSNRLICCFNQGIRLVIIHGSPLHKVLTWRRDNISILPKLWKSN